jgi:hypothetical protein
MTSTDLHYLGHEFHFWPSMFGVISQWSVEDVRGAINQHDAGWFAMSASLAVVASRFPTIYGPLEQRLGIPLGVEREIVGGDRGPARRAKEDFATYMRRMESEFEDIFLPHCMMGVSWLHTHYVERGGDLLPTTKVWPSVGTRFNETWGRYEALTSEGWIAMPDGDGKWTKVGSGERPHRLGAIRALGEPWAKAAYAERDEAGLTAFLGRLAPYAILPEAKGGTGGAAVTPKSKEGLEIAEALKMLGRARGGGLFPAGTKINSLDGIDAGTASLFTDIFGRSKSNHAIAILGTDGTVSPGSGGVYVSPIFGRVALTTIRRDIAHGTRAFNQIARTTTTLNYGEAVQSPEYKWLLPDPSEAERRDALAKAYAAFNATVKGWRDAGLDVTDNDIAALAADLGVKAPTGTPTPGVGP